MNTPIYIVNVDPLKRDKQKYKSFDSYKELNGSTISFVFDKETTATLTTPFGDEFKSPPTPSLDFEEISYYLYSEVIDNNFRYEGFWDDVMLEIQTDPNKEIEYVEFTTTNGEFDLPILPTLTPDLTDPNSVNYIGPLEELKIKVKSEDHQVKTFTPYTNEGMLRDLGAIGIKDNETSLKEETEKTSNLSDDQVKNLLKKKKNSDWYFQKMIRDLITTVKATLIPLVLDQVIKKFQVTNPLELIDKIKEQKQTLKSEEAKLEKLKTSKIPESKKNELKQNLLNKSKNQINILIQDSLPSEDFCPSNDIIERVISVKNSLTSQLNKMMTTINVITTLLGITGGFIVLLQSLITALKVSPIPIPPFSPVSLVGIIEDLKDESGSELGKLSKINSSVLSILLVLNQTLTVILGLLNLLDLLIERCAQPIETETLNEDLLALNEINFENGETQPESLLVNGFLLNVESFSSNDGLNRKRAIAKDSKGITVLRGEPSFSSTDQILIDELSFYIKQNNLKAE